MRRGEYRKFRIRGAGAVAWDGTRRAGDAAGELRSSPQPRSPQPRASVQSRRLRGDARGRAPPLSQDAGAGRTVSGSRCSSTAARVSCRRPTRRSRSSGSRTWSRSGSRRKRSCSTRATPRTRSRSARNDPALLLIQRIRDEAHRFAVTFHRRARTMRDLRSELDHVPGIGPRRRKTLLTTFGSLAGVRRATREELRGGGRRENRGRRPCVFRESAVTFTVAGYSLSRNFHRHDRAAVLADSARDGACVDGRSSGRSDGAAARPGVVESRLCTPISIGTIVFPLIAMVSGAPLLGWAKPVPVNMRYLRHPRRDYMLVAAAGPASNLVLAVSAAIVLAIMPVSPQTLDEPNGHRAARGDPQPADSAQRAARGVQHDSDSAARRRQRAGRAAAGVAGGDVQSSAPVRLPVALRAHPLRRVSLHRRFRRIVSSSRGCRHSDLQGTRRFRHAADRPPAPRPSRRRARQLGAAAGQVRLLLLRRRLARADERLRRHQPADLRTPTRTSPTGSAPGSTPRRAPSSSSRSCPSTPSSTCCFRWWCRCRGSNACRPTRSSRRT